MDSIPSKLFPVVEAAYKGTLTTGEILTFERIISIAEEMASKKGWVDYSDYDEDLLREVLNGFWAPSSLGWRLQTIRYVLKQKGWGPQGRPVKFYPPKKPMK